MKFLRVVRASLSAFFRDQVFLHASSLTFYTLLSIVPILAVAFGLAKGFGFEDTLRRELQQRFAEQREFLDFAVKFSLSLLEQVEGGIIAGVGSLFLFLFVLSLFWTIENSMNAIWHVKRSRNFLRMLTEYLAMMIICPFLFVIAGSLMIFVTTHIYSIVEHHDVLKKITPPIFLVYRAISLWSLWALFTCLYLIMPNTRVRIKYGLIAGIFAGTLFYFVQLAILEFQIGVSQYNAIYGSFAALPLFLLWLQVSWILVLFGAEIAYHYEVLSPLMETDQDRMSISRVQLALLVVDRVVDRFHRGVAPWSFDEMLKSLGIATPVLQEIVDLLCRHGILSQVRSDNDVFYQPVKDPKTITLRKVAGSLDEKRNEILEVYRSDDAEKIRQVWNNYEEKADVSPANLAISEI